MIEMAAIRARLEAATPGPWVGTANQVHGPGRAWLFEAPCSWGEVDEQANCAFVAHARDDVLALLDEVERLRAYQ